MHLWPHQHLTCPNSLVDASNPKPSGGLIRTSSSIRIYHFKKCCIKNPSRLEIASNTSIASSNKNLITLSQKNLFIVSIKINIVIVWVHFHLVDTDAALYFIAKFINQRSVWWHYGNKKKNNSKCKGKKKKTRKEGVLRILEGWEKLSPYIINSRIGKGRSDLKWAVNLLTNNIIHHPWEVGFKLKTKQ